METCLSSPRSPLWLSWGWWGGTGEGNIPPNWQSCARESSKLGWAVQEGTAHIWFVWEHQKHSRMGAVVPEVLFPPSSPGFLGLPSPAAATSLDKTTFEDIEQQGRGRQG